MEFVPFVNIEYFLLMYTAVMSKPAQPNISAAGVLVEWEGKYLVGKSIDGWSDFGGKREKGETAEETAVRELFEESRGTIEMSVRELKLLAIRIHDVKPYSDNPKYMYRCFVVSMPHDLASFHAAMAAGGQPVTFNEMIDITTVRSNAGDGHQRLLKILARERKYYGNQEKIKNRLLREITEHRKKQAKIETRYRTEWTESVVANFHSPLFT